MRKVLGLLIAALGVLLLAWIGYNLFIERLPETQGRNPVGPAVFAIILVGVGGKMFSTPS